MIKIRYVVEVVDRDCFRGSENFEKSFDSEEEAWEYYREQQKLAHCYTDPYTPYFDQVYYALEPRLVVKEVRELTDEEDAAYFPDYDDEIDF